MSDVKIDMSGVILVLCAIVLAALIGIGLIIGGFIKQKNSLKIAGCIILTAVVVLFMVLTA